jgi:hypothetical protein
LTQGELRLASAVMPCRPAQSCRMWRARKHDQTTSHSVWEQGRAARTVTQSSCRLSSFAGVWRVCPPPPQPAQQGLPPAGAEGHTSRRPPPRVQGALQADVTSSLSFPVCVQNHQCWALFTKTTRVPYHHQTDARVCHHQVTAGILAARFLCCTAIFVSSHRSGMCSSCATRLMLSPTRAHATPQSASSPLLLAWRCQHTSATPST